MFFEMYTILYNAALRSQKAMDDGRFEEAKQILQEGIDTAEDFIVDFNFDAADEEERRMRPFLLGEG